MRFFDYHHPPVGDYPEAMNTLCAFSLIAAGVAAMFALSAVGGIGGRSGHSLWWGLLILPYPVGWLMALAGGVAGLVRFFKAKGQRAPA